MNANGHTPDRWEQRPQSEGGYIGHAPNQGCGVTAIASLYCEHVRGAYHFPAELERNANAQLIIAAPTAPHECDDPACPGNVNRRKLEAIDGLLVVCELVTTVQTIRDFTVARDLAHVAIAKAKL